MLVEVFSFVCYCTCTIICRNLLSLVTLVSGGGAYYHDSLVFCNYSSLIVSVAASLSINCFRYASFIRNLSYYASTSIVGATLLLCSTCDTIITIRWKMYIGIAELQGRNGWLSMQLPYQYLFPLYLYNENMIYVDGTLYTLSLPLFPHSAI